MENTSGYVVGWLYMPVTVTVDRFISGSCVKEKRIIWSFQHHLHSLISFENKQKNAYLVGGSFCTSRFMMMVQNYSEDRQTFCR